MTTLQLIRLSLFTLFGLFPTVLTAQSSASSDVQPNTLRTHSTMLGLGYRNSLDTYLSPEEYTGTELRLMRENMRMTKLMDGHVSVQNIMQGNFTYTKTATEDGKELGGLFDWNITWHYHLQPLPQLTLMAGVGPGFHCGFVYNTRNGNNPAQARLSTEVNLSAMAIWKVPLARQTLTLRYQVDIPTVGLMFSPNYGQSYYEIFSLGHYDHNVCFTNLFQAFSCHHLLTADYPFKWGTMRIGYLGSARQFQVNNLKQHDWSHLFLIGYVKHFRLVKSLNTSN